MGKGASTIAIIMVFGIFASFGISAAHAEVQTKKGAKESGESIATVKGAKLGAAAAHYARARSLVIAAVNEFDRGLKIANPDALVDSKKWRASLVDRARELEKVLDPQAKESSGGVRLDPDSRLIGQEGS